MPMWCRGGILNHPRTTHESPKNHPNSPRLSQHLGSMLSRGWVVVDRERCCDIFYLDLTGAVFIFEEDGVVRQKL